MLIWDKFNNVDLRIYSISRTKTRFIFGNVNDNYDHYRWVKNKDKTHWKIKKPILSYTLFLKLKFNTYDLYNSYYLVIFYDTYYTKFKHIHDFTEYVYFILIMHIETKIV